MYRRRWLRASAAWGDRHPRLRILTGWMVAAGICAWVAVVEDKHPPRTTGATLLFCGGALLSVSLMVVGSRPRTPAKKPSWLLWPAVVLCLCGLIFGLGMSRNAGDGVNLYTENREFQAFFAGAALGVGALFVVGAWRAVKRTQLRDLDPSSGTSPTT